MEGGNPRSGGGGQEEANVLNKSHTPLKMAHTRPRRSGGGGEIVHVAPARASFVPASPSEYCLLAEWMGT